MILYCSEMWVATHAHVVRLAIIWNKIFIKSKKKQKISFSTERKRENFIKMKIPPQTLAV